MRTRLAVLAAALLCSVAAPEPASASTVRGVIHRVEARVEGNLRCPCQNGGARMKAAAPGRTRLRGSSSEGPRPERRVLARRAVSPSDPHLAKLRKQCSGTSAAFDAGQIPNSSRDASRGATRRKISRSDQLSRQRVSDLALERIMNGEQLTVVGRRR